MSISLTCTDNTNTIQKRESVPKQSFVSCPFGYEYIYPYCYTTCPSTHFRDSYTMQCLSTRDFSLDDTCPEDTVNYNDICYGPCSIKPCLIESTSFLPVLSCPSNTTEYNGSCYLSCPIYPIAKSVSGVLTNIYNFKSDSNPDEQKNCPGLGSHYFSSACYNLNCDNGYHYKNGQCLINSSFSFLSKPPTSTITCPPQNPSLINGCCINSMPESYYTLDSQTDPKFYISNYIPSQSLSLYLPYTRNWLQCSNGIRYGDSCYNKCSSSYQKYDGKLSCINTSYLISEPLGCYTSEYPDLVVVDNVSYCYQACPLPQPDPNGTYDIPSNYGWVRSINYNKPSECVYGKRAVNTSRINASCRPGYKKDINNTYCFPYLDPRRRTTTPSPCVSEEQYTYDYNTGICEIKKIPVSKVETVTVKSCNTSDYPILKNSTSLCYPALLDGYLYNNNENPSYMYPIGAKGDIYNISPTSPDCSPNYENIQGSCYSPCPIGYKRSISDTTCIYNSKNSISPLFSGSLMQVSVSSLTIPTLSECQTYCQNNTNSCKAFQYDNNTLQCQLFSSIPTTYDPTITTSFYKYTTDTNIPYVRPQVYNTSINGSLLGLPSYMLNSTSLSCQKICDNYTYSCKGFQYNSSDSICQIFSVLPTLYYPYDTSYVYFQNTLGTSTPSTLSNPYFNTISGCLIGKSMQTKTFSTMSQCQTACDNSKNPDCKLYNFSGTTCDLYNTLPSTYDPTVTKSLYRIMLSISSVPSVRTQTYSDIEVSGSLLGTSSSTTTQVTSASCKESCDKSTTTCQGYQYNKKNTQCLLFSTLPSTYDPTVTSSIYNYTLKNTAPTVRTQIYSTTVSGSLLGDTPILSISSPSLSDCQKSCDQNITQCNGFQYTSTNNKCKLYSNIPTTYTPNNTESTIKYTNQISSILNPRQQSYNNSVKIGSLIGNPTFTTTLSSASLTLCQLECDKSASCQGYQYNNKTCQLFNPLPLTYDPTDTTTQYNYITSSTNPPTIRQQQYKNDYPNASFQIDYTTKKLSNTITQSLSSCEKLCDSSITPCLAYQYNSQNGSCQLFSSVPIAYIENISNQTIKSVLNKGSSIPIVDSSFNLNSFTNDINVMINDLSNMNFNF